MSKSPVRLNAEHDESYRPHCLKCDTMLRMIKVARFVWVCACGAVCDERTWRERLSWNSFNPLKILCRIFGHIPYSIPYMTPFCVTCRNWLKRDAKGGYAIMSEIEYWSPNNRVGGF